MAGQGAQIAFRGEDFGKTRDLAGVDRGAAHRRLGGEKGRDRLLAFLVPGLTIVMGVLVAGVVTSILSALFSIYDIAL